LPIRLGSEVGDPDVHGEAAPRISGTPATDGGLDISGTRGAHDERRPVRDHAVETGNLLGTAVVTREQNRSGHVGPRVSLTFFDSECSDPEEEDKGFTFPLIRSCR
jgi:hypothetical protein